ncbi:glycosyltransferase family 4 protein [Fibrella sp. HMF5335]|uniref:Glycosyltransferase family 4 protein n=1 Tax=Fibrella rubiginis TaxID=2817060 RepID=A0A939GG93_9BACT|nr:glycosyltransferase family 4 protein [Fibrella rubiginis]MBO0936935.1 glycosyltransferase family 4 protein [Fibrella rubiginis]
MRLLIVHNTLWAHYKSLLFSQLANQVTPPDSMLVLQIALTEGNRHGLGVPDPATVGYPFQLLHPGTLESLSTAQRISRVVRAGLAYKPDVVLLTGYYDPAQLLLGLLLKLRGCRVVLQSESTALDNPRMGWREGLKKTFVGLCDAFFCFGSRAADYLVQLGANPVRIRVRNNAVVDNDLLKRIYDQALPKRLSRQGDLGLQPKNLIYVGRLAEEKNLIQLVNSFAQAKHNAGDTTWGLLLLGEGPQKAALQAEVARLNLNGSVHFLPGCDWTDVPTYLALADTLVLPSLSEPWGLVVNEAMACGLPVLVSDRCGCAVDLVEQGQNGYTFSPDNPAMLTRQVSQLMGLSDKALQQMGEASLARIAHWAPEPVGRAMYLEMKRLTNPTGLATVPQPHQTDL